MAQAKTNVSRVTEELAQEVLKSINSLKTAVDDLEKAVKGRKAEDVIPIEWVMNANRHFVRAWNDIARINGAVLVRVD